MEDSWITILEKAAQCLRHHCGRYTFRVGRLRLRGPLELASPGILNAFKMSKSLEVPPPVICSSLSSLLL